MAKNLRILTAMRKIPLSPRCLAALLIVAPMPGVAAPLITEFLASNQTGLTDEDLTHPDWIETMAFLSRRRSGHSPRG